jgi:hypothetical protein
MQQSRQPNEEAPNDGDEVTGTTQLDSDLANLLSQLDTSALAERGLREILQDNGGRLPPLEGQVFDELAAAVAVAVNEMRREYGGVPDRVTGDYLRRVAERAVQQMQAM